MQVAAEVESLVRLAAMQGLLEASGQRAGPRRVDRLGTVGDGTVAAAKLGSVGVSQPRSASSTNSNADRRQPARSDGVWVERMLSDYALSEL